MNWVRSRSTPCAEEAMAPSLPIPARPSPNARGQIQRGPLLLERPSKSSFFRYQPSGVTGNTLWLTRRQAFRRAFTANMVTLRLSVNGSVEIFRTWFVTKYRGAAAPGCPLYSRPVTAPLPEITGASAHHSRLRTYLRRSGRRRGPHPMNLSLLTSRLRAPRMGGMGHRRGKWSIAIVVGVTAALYRLAQAHMGVSR